MKNHKKRQQREEIRKILATMRLELAAQRLAQEKGLRQPTTLHLGEFLSGRQQSLGR